MTRLVLLVTLLASFTVLSPLVTNQGLGSPANVKPPVGSTRADGGSMGEQGLVTARDTVAALDCVRPAGGANAVDVRRDVLSGAPADGRNPCAFLGHAADRESVWPVSAEMSRIDHRAQCVLHGREVELRGVVGVESGSVANREGVGGRGTRLVVPTDTPLILPSERPARSPGADGGGQLPPEFGLVCVAQNEVDLSVLQDRIAQSPVLADLLELARENGGGDALFAMEFTYEDGHVMSLAPLSDGAPALYLMSLGPLFEGKAFLCEIGTEGIRFFDSEGSVRLRFDSLIPEVNTGYRTDECTYWTCLGGCVSHYLTEDIWFSRLCTNWCDLVCMGTWDPLLCAPCAGCLGGAFIGCAGLCADDVCRYCDCPDPAFAFGWVKHANGQPWAGVDVRLADCNGNPFGPIMSTTDTGLFSINAGGVSQVQILFDRHCTPFCISEDCFALDPGSNEVGTFFLPSCENLAEIHGTALHSNGTLWSGVEVFVADCSVTELYAYGVSDNNGDVYLEFPPGNVDFLFICPECPTFALHTGCVYVSQGIHAYNFPLPECPTQAILNGRVLQEETGTTWSGVTVSATDCDDSVLDQDDTNSQGEYSIAFTAQDFQLVFDRHCSDGELWETDCLSITPGDYSVSDIELPACLPSLDYSVMCDWAGPECGQHGPPKTAFDCEDEAWSYCDISNTAQGGIVVCNWVREGETRHSVSWTITEPWTSVCCWSAWVPDLPGSWHVEVKYDGECLGSGPTFTVSSPALPPPTLLSPGDGTTAQPTSGSLDWAEVAGATGYTVQLGTSCGVGDEEDTNSSYWSYSGLTSGITYYWRAKTRNTCGQYGDYSDCFSFVAAIGPDINCEAIDGGHAFGTVAENTCSAEHTWQVTNTGDAPVQGDVFLSGPDCTEFEITQGADQSCFPLVPGHSCTIGARFCPTSASEELKQCTLHISTNVPDESPCDIALTGKGIDFGDCSDGDVILDPNASNLCVLQRDMNYRNLTVPPGITLDTHGYTVKVCEDLVNYGVITDNWSGGAGGAGGAGGMGDNPWGTDVPSGCGPRDDSGSCQTDGLGEDGAQGGAPAVPEAGSGGQGGGGGGGGGGSWHWLTMNDADGGNGGDGGQGGKGGGYVKVYAYRFDNQGVIHADGKDGEAGEDAPEGDSTYSGGAPGGYLHCGAEYHEFTYLLLPRDLSGGGGGGGGGAGGEGGTAEFAYYEMVTRGEIHAKGGQGGQRGNGGSSGGDCVHQPIFAMVNYACGNDEYCGCDGGQPNGGRGGGGGVNGDCGQDGVCPTGATSGELGSLGDEGVDGEFISDDLAECSGDADCDDGLYCNGLERCVDGECVPGTPPDCDDGLDCTIDWCDDAGAECRHDLEPGYCLIDGVCYVSGERSPANECEECNPLISASEWSPRPEGAPCGNWDAGPCDSPDTCDGAGGCQPNELPDPGPLPPPALQSPPDGATCQSISGTLEWPEVNEAAGYMVQIGTGDCGTGTEYPVSVSSYSYSGLQPNTQYYWRVKTQNACGSYGDYSGCSSLVTESGGLAAPILQSPVDGATDQPTLGTLEWDEVPDATGYRLRIGWAYGTVAEYDVVASEYEYSDLSLGATYYWSVKTQNACGGYGSYSEPFSFTTATFLAMDMNGDGFRSIIGDVPPFVDCVYFSDCNCPTPGCTPRGDCNYDGFLSIIGDVPCFVDCVYFGDCGGRDSPEGCNGTGSDITGRFAIGGAVYTDLHSPLSSGLENVTIELVGPLPGANETPTWTSTAKLGGGVEAPVSGAATQLSVEAADARTAMKVFATAQTGSMGLWQIDGVPRGEYVVRAIMPTYVLRHVHLGVPSQQDRVTFIVGREREAANQSIQFLATPVSGNQ